METQSRENSLRINLTTYDPGTSYKKARRLNYVIGGLFLLSSLFMFFDYLEEGTDLFRHILFGGMYLVAGIVFLFRAKTNFSESSKIIPHILTTKEGIKIKTSLLGKAQYIKWNDIEKVEIRKERIGFKLNNSNNRIYYVYKSTEDTPIKIKRAIEYLDLQKRIQVDY
jgi:hypothetical protein